MSESTTPTPEPMTGERLAEIRERAESVKTWKGYHAEPVPQLLDVDVPALLAEVERLRSDLDDQRTLYQTAKAIAEQATKWHTDARAELERYRDHSTRRNRASRARLNAEVAAARKALAAYPDAEKTAAAIRQAEAERDAAREQVEKVSAWVTSDVVTARSEFGNGYREAMRDARDLLNGGEAATS